MTWHRTLAGWLTDILWVIARSGLLINMILLSLLSVWFVFKGCWKLREILDAWLFE